MQGKQHLVREGKKTKPPKRPHNRQFCVQRVVNRSSRVKRGPRPVLKTAQTAPRACPVTARYSRSAPTTSRARRLICRNRKSEVTSKRRHTIRRISRGRDSSKVRVQVGTREKACDIDLWIGSCSRGLNLMTARPKSRR
jgi:hypothetical protein